MNLQSKKTEEIVTVQTDVGEFHLFRGVWYGIRTSIQDGKERMLRVKSEYCEQLNQIAGFTNIIPFKK